MSLGCESEDVEISWVIHTFGLLKKLGEVVSLRSVLPLFGELR